MEPISPDELFFPPLDEGSPGAQVHLYRLLHLLATQGASDADALLVSYPGAKKIAGRLGIKTPEQLIKVFRYMGFGDLKVDIQPGLIRASVTTVDNSPRTTSWNAGNASLRRHLCEFQRGLIDGGLQHITALPVTSGETHCYTRGDSQCVFEAVGNEIAGTRGYVPREMKETGDRTMPGSTSSTAQGMRSWFMELAGRELARAKRHNRRLSLLYVDIDNLGGVNAAYGRPAGDDAISAAGTAISRTCRSEDFLWHHGEDEFAIILTETDASGAAGVAERLAVQIKLAAELIDVSTALSACIGFATYPDNAESVSDLFRTAKSALYLAKATGKGEVQGAESLPGKNTGTSSQRQLRYQEMASVKKDHRQNAQADLSLPETGKFDQARSAATAAIHMAGDIQMSSESSTAERKYSVVVASNSHLVLMGMKHELQAITGIDVTGEFTRLGPLLTFIEDDRPDLVLIDTEIATADNFALPKFIKEQNLPCKIMVIVEEASQEVLKLAADYKVEGMVTQNSTPADLMSAMDSVHEGRVVMPEKIRATLNELESSRKVLGELSDRELEVLGLVADGKPNSQISEELFITVNTVRFHLANIYQKLSVSNRTEAANYFLRQDIPPEDQAKLL